MPSTDHPRPALEQHPPRRARAAARRHAGVPAAALRAPARARVPRLSRARRTPAFEHALGAYHLARRTLALLDERGDARDVDPRRRLRDRSRAALLHDIGHYPFSHALEEIGALHHEEVARPLITDRCASPRCCATTLGSDAPERDHARSSAARAPARCRDSSPARSTSTRSSTCKRDALMCGVPYGEIDVDRLLNALAVVRDPDTRRHDGRRRREGALRARVAAVRQVSDVPQRLLAPRRAQRDGDVQAARRRCARAPARSTPSTLAAFTDEGLLARAGAPRADAAARRACASADCYKRAFECPAARASRRRRRVDRRRSRARASRSRTGSPTSCELARGRAAARLSGQDADARPRPAGRASHR